MWAWLFFLFCIDKQCNSLLRKRQDKNGCRQLTKRGLPLPRSFAWRQIVNFLQFRRQIVNFQQFWRQMDNFLSNRTPRTADCLLSAMRSSRCSTLLRHKESLYAWLFSYILSLDQSSRKTMSGQCYVALRTQMAVNGRMKILINPAPAHWRRLEHVWNCFHFSKKACDLERYDQFILDNSHANKIPSCDQGGWGCD